MINSISFGRTNPKTIENRKQTKSALINAEKTLRELQTAFGKPKSSSYLSLIGYNHNNFINDKKTSNTLFLLKYFYDFKMKKLPEQCVQNKKPEKYFQSTYGNCSECAKAVQSYYYSKDKTPSLIIAMDMIKFEKGHYGNHAFNITNYDKDMDVKNPKTWGKQAIVTDLWSGIALKSDDAIEYFERMYVINPLFDKVTFSYLRGKEDSLQTKFLKDMGVDTNDSSVMYDNIV